MSLGICLAGGGIKGAAHIGVLKAFEEEKIKFDIVSGASSGSIIAALYALEYTTDEMYKIFKEYARDITYVSVGNIFKLLTGIVLNKKIVISGLNNGKKLYKHIEKICKDKSIKNISELKMPLYISSVDLNSGETIIFTNKICRCEENMKLITDIELATAVRASCAFPGIFEPVGVKKELYVDGGIRENIPWKILRCTNVDQIVSVVFENELKSNCGKNLINVVACSIQYLNDELQEYELDGTGNIIQIKAENIGLLDSSKVDYMYEIGYKTAKKHIQKI